MAALFRIRTAHSTALPSMGVVTALAPCSGSRPTGQVTRKRICTASPADHGGWPYALIVEIAARCTARLRISRGRVRRRFQADSQGIELRRDGAVCFSKRSRRRVPARGLDRGKGGTLYGTTSGLGGDGCYTCGTVSSLTPQGSTNCGSAFSIPSGAQRSTARIRPAP